MTKSIILALLLFRACSAQTKDSSQRTSTVAGAVTSRTFFGTSAPGSVTGNLPGDRFIDTTGHVEYYCGATSGTSAPACTTVTAGGWATSGSGVGGGLLIISTTGGATNTLVATPSPAISSYTNVSVAFTVDACVSGDTTLNISSLGAAHFWLNGAVLSSSVPPALCPGTTYTASYNGTQFALTSLNSYISGDASLNPVTGVLTTVGNPITGLNLQAFRIALTNTILGTSDTKVLFIGDSTTIGYQDNTTATVTAATAYPAYVTIPGLQVSPGMANGQGLGANDNRWTLGTGWSNVGGPLAFGFSVGNFQGTSTTGDLLFTPQVSAGPYDSFDVYYLTNTGFGTIAITATGGGTTTISTNSAASIAKATVVASSVGTNNTVTIHQTGGAATVFIVGIEPFLSTARRVRIGNVGQVGSLASQWARSSVPFGAIQMLQAYAPNLTVISLGINDANNSVTPASFSSDMQSIITAALTTGSVILATMPPSQGAGYTTLEPLYQPVYYALASTNGVPLLDLYKRFGSSFNSLLMNADGVHPNQQGYTDWGESTGTLISSVVGKQPPVINFQTPTLTAGTGIASVTCATATCTQSRGTLTIAGGTATTGTIASLAWAATPLALTCTATMNGGATSLGIGNSVATTTGFNVTAGVTVFGVTFTVNYSCQ